MATKTKQPANIHERIRRGDFDRNQTYPEKPPRPALLNKAAGLMTDLELAAIQGVKAVYAEQMEAWRKEMDEYRNQGSKMEQGFRKALLESHGMDPELPITDMLYRLACENGHANGFSEVASCMHDLAEVYREAIRMRDEARK